jgi:hypothetical protein
MTGAWGREKRVSRCAQDGATTGDKGEADPSLPLGMAWDGARDDIGVAIDFIPVVSSSRSEDRLPAQVPAPRPFHR